MEEKLLNGLDQLTLGRKIVRVGPNTREPVYYEIIAADSNRVKLRADCGEIIDLDPEYVLDNFGFIDTQKSSIKFEDRTNSAGEPACNAVNDCRCVTRGQLESIELN